MNKPNSGAACPVYLQIFSPIYSAAWRLARPFLAKHKRLQQGFASRLVPQNWALPNADGLTIWIQAASGGEAYLLVKLWRQIKKEYQGKVPLKILATSCTKQGMEVFERVLQEDACKAKINGDSQAGEVKLSLAYFPFDQPNLMKKALELAAPTLICLLETELWPGLLLAARNKNIPVLLLNGRITPKSLSGYKLFPASFWRALAPTRILAISQADARRFADLFGDDQVEMMPNIKFDLLMQADPTRSAAKAGEGDCENLSGLLPGDGLGLAGGIFPNKTDAGAQSLLCPPVVVFGSVRRQEAEAVVQAITKLHSLNPDCLIVLAPRHLHHVHVWERQLKLAGRSYLLRSQIQNADDLEPQAVLQKFADFKSQPGDLLGANNLKAEVVIWDRFGELKKLYAQAAAVFVGGSLAPLGGQNFLEVLEHGLEPCIGPHWSNFAWAGPDVLDLVKQVDNPEELALTLNEQLLNPQSREAVKTSFKNFIHAHQGGTEVAVKAIIDFLPPA